MINLKTFGLALVAVFAFAAMSASAASAQNGLVTSDGPVWIDGTDKGEPPARALTAFGGTTECETGHYTGGKVGGTSGGHHVALTSPPASAITLAPKYTNCTSGTGLPETVTMNGCDYVVKIGTTIGPHKYSATTDLVCPEGNEVTIDVYASATAHANNEVLCSIHVPAQVNRPGAEIEDETNGHLTLGGTANNVMMTSTCGHNPPTVNDAVLHLSITLSGTNTATGGPTNNTPLSLSHL